MELSSLTGSQKNYLLNLHQECYKGHNKAARLFNEKYTDCQINPQEVIDFWASIGLEKSKAGGYTHGFSEGDLRRLHKRHRGNIERMATESGTTQRILVGKCAKLHLPYVIPPKPKTNEYKPKIHSGYNHFRRACPPSKLRRAKN